MTSSQWRAGFMLKQTTSIAIFFSVIVLFFGHYLICVLLLTSLYSLTLYLPLSE